MKSWEFKLESKEDLKPFHDLLEEEQHPGAKVVEWMIKNNKWPSVLQKTSGHHKPFCFWIVNAQRRKEIKGSNRLPIGTFGRAGYHWFNSINHAIWTVIIDDFCRRL